MRPYQSTLKASIVHAYARHLLLQTLELTDYRPAIPLRLVASVLILAACWQTSLTGACALLRDKPCHRHVRAALNACLPPRPRDLLSRLLHALRQSLPEDLFWRPTPMAIDLHQRPYYGKKNTKGCTRRQKKAGTRRSFTYATLAVLDRGGRFTVGLLATRPSQRLTTVVGQLLQQAQEVGLEPAYLLLDKGFCSAEVVALLQKRGVPFLVPVVRRGQRGQGNTWLFEPARPVGWYDYTWTTPVRRRDPTSGRRRRRRSLSVTVRACVARQPGDGKPLVYATWGLGKGWSVAQVVSSYRRRFGIEASYRQLGQCLARTRSRREDTT